MTKITAIECPICGYIIYSRARHDFRTCECESCFVDGGFDYLRYGGPTEGIKQHQLELSLTRQELYEDWNNRIDKYGFIAPCGPPLSSTPCAELGESND